MFTTEMITNVLSVSGLVLLTASLLVTKKYLKSFFTF